MSVAIHTIALGIDRCHLLQAADGRVVLVDAGMPGQERRFDAGLSKLGIGPEQIVLVVITHGHWDHIGCAQAIKKKTDAPIAMHVSESRRLEEGFVSMPKGITRWGRIFAVPVGWLSRRAAIPRASVDIAVEDDGLDLRDYGIEGKAVHTPGHSPGSLSVVLDTGEAFVGDLAMNGPPLRFGPGLPIFAEDEQSLLPSWNKLFDLGIKTIYPAHGPSFSAAVMRDLVS